MPPDKSIIVAVGRSGTTIIHRLLLEIYVDLFGTDFECLYEPFVWDSSLVGHYPRDAARESQFGRRDAMSARGLFLHEKVPLFVDDGAVAGAVGDLADYLRAGTTRPLLAKFIRANGRLGALDRLYPDGRFILTLRNPLDVVNSVLTKFSFFGPEFHKNDFPRFARDVETLFGVKLGSEQALPPAYRAALWCHFMNLRAVGHAAGNPRYKIVVYEDFSRNREAYAREICAHIGAPYKDAYAAVTAKSVGRVTQGAPALCKADVDAIMPLFEEYGRLIAAVPQISAYDPPAILRKYTADRLRAAPVDERGLGWSPVKLESELIALRRALGDVTRAGRERTTDIQRRTLAAEAGRAADIVPVGVIVTSFNNGATIGRTLDSLRAQTLPVSEIIVADDGSTDGSRSLLESAAAADSRIRLILRERNVGVSANRNDAIREARTPFVCQVDGDDAFHPAKIEREARALQGRMDSVAFSDTVKLDPEEYWDCSWLAGLSGSSAVAGMVSRRSPLPRDMLMARELFLAAGGYREECSIYEDWGFKIRLAEKARHWLYSGGPGTAYRPGGLSRAARINHVHGGLWILCHDVGEVIGRAHCNAAALAGLLKLMRVEADVDPDPDGPLESAIGAKIAIIMDEIRHGLLDRPASAYARDDQAFFARLTQLLATVGVRM